MGLIASNRRQQKYQRYRTSHPNCGGKEVEYVGGQMQDSDFAAVDPACPVQANAAIRPRDIADASPRASGNRSYAKQPAKMIASAKRISRDESEHRKRLGDPPGEFTGKIPLPERGIVGW